MIEERLTGARIALTPHLPETSKFIALRTASIGDDLAHRDRDRVTNFDPGMMRASGNRLAFRGIEAAARRHPQFDAVEEAFILRYRRVDKAGQLCNDIAASVAERRPRVDLGPGVRPVEVNDEPSPCTVIATCTWISRLPDGSEST